jgi:hypothetical protein
MSNINVNSNSGVNNNVHPAQTPTSKAKKENSTSFFKNTKVLCALAAAAGLTGYAVLKGQNDHVVPSPSWMPNPGSLISGAIVVAILAGVVKYLNSKPQINSETKIKRLIGNVMDADIGSQVDLYRNYTNTLQKNFRQFLNILENEHREQPFTQENINKLFSYISLPKITDPDDIELIRHCLTSETPLNQMIKNAVKNACRVEMAISLAKLEINKFSEENKEEKAWHLTNIMKNPSMFWEEVENENTDFGLQVYTRLSYDLVMEQIEPLKKQLEKIKPSYDVDALKTLLEDKEAVKQIEEMKISPLNKEAGEILYKVFCRKNHYEIGRGGLHTTYPTQEKYFDALENEFIDYANDHLSNIFKALGRIQQMQIIAQDEIDKLFTGKFFSHLCEEQMAIMREHLNKNTPLNAMILKAFKTSCIQAVDSSYSSTNPQKDLVNYFKLDADILKPKIEPVFYDQISELAKEPSIKHKLCKLDSDQAKKSTSEKSTLATIIDAQTDSRAKQEKEYDDQLEATESFAALKIKDADAVIRLRIIRCLPLDEPIKNIYVNMLNPATNWEIGMERDRIFIRFTSMYGTQANYAQGKEKMFIAHAKNNREEVLASIEQIKNLELNEKEKEVSEQIIEKCLHLFEIANKEGRASLETEEKKEPPEWAKEFTAMLIEGKK